MCKLIKTDLHVGCDIIVSTVARQIYPPWAIMSSYISLSSPVTSILDHWINTGNILNTIPWCSQPKCSNNDRITQNQIRAVFIIIKYTSWKNTQNLLQPYTIN